MALGLVWALVSLLVLSTIFLFDKMGFFSGKNHFPVQGRTVLVTGGSQGMGKAVAELFAKKGANVIIVARTVQKLQEAIGDIKSHALDAASQRFHYISADLTNPSDAASVLSESTKWNDNRPIDILMSIAGSSRPLYFLETPPATFKEQIDTNYLSHAYISQAACQSWLSKSEKTTAPSKSTEPRHIIFVSTLATLIPLIGYSPYAPAKAALRHLSDTLSRELALYEHHTPIKSHCVFAGTISSPGLEQENKTKPEITKKLEEDDPVQTPEEIALATVKALERGDENVVPTGFLGMLLKAGSLGGCKRNGFGIVETLLSWLASLIFPFVMKDFDGKIRAFGKAKNL